MRTRVKTLRTGTNCKRCASGARSHAVAHRQSTYADGHACCIIVETQGAARIATTSYSRNCTHAQSSLRLFALRKHRLCAASRCSRFRWPLRGRDFVPMKQSVGDRMGRAIQRVGQRRCHTKSHTRAQCNELPSWKSQYRIIDIKGCCSTSATTSIKEPP